MAYRLRAYSRSGASDYSRTIIFDPAEAGKQTP